MDTNDLKNLIFEISKQHIKFDISNCYYNNYYNNSNKDNIHQKTHQQNQMNDCFSNLVFDRVIVFVFNETIKVICDYSTMEIEKNDKDFFIDNLVILNSKELDLTQSSSITTFSLTDLLFGLWSNELNNIYDACIIKNKNISHLPFEERQSHLLFENEYNTKFNQKYIIEIKTNKENKNLYDFLKQDFIYTIMLKNQKNKEEEVQLLEIHPCISTERYAVSIPETEEIIGNCLIDSIEVSLFLHNYFNQFNNNKPPENQKLILPFHKTPKLYNNNNDYKRYKLAI